MDGIAIGFVMPRTGLAFEAGGQDNGGLIMDATELDKSTEFDEQQDAMNHFVSCEFRRAIAAAFPGAIGKLEIRRLWSRGETSYFRVNWWTGFDGGNARIRASEFVAVDYAESELVVHRLTPRRAA